MSVGDDVGSVGNSSKVTASNNGEITTWFAGRARTTLLLFKVNRRPLEIVRLEANQPEDVLVHLNQTLLFGETVETGRSQTRRWRLGNHQVDFDARFLTGRLGYVKASEQYKDHYDEESKDWSEDLQPADVTAQAPFAFDAVTRYLAVLRHPTFDANQVARVFTKLLNRGEEARSDEASTDWDVELLLDEADFIQWIRTADAVLSVTFTAKLPNPDGSKELGLLWTRLNNMRAKRIEEHIVASSEIEGLSDIENDSTIKSYIAFAARAYGWIKGTRRRNNGIEYFNQHVNTRTHDLHNLPATFIAVVTTMVEYLKSEREGGTKK